MKCWRYCYSLKWRGGEWIVVSIRFKKTRVIFFIFCKSAKNKIIHQNIQMNLKQLSTIHLFTFGRATLSAIFHFLQKRFIKKSENNIH